MVALALDGRMYSWGRNDYGQLAVPRSQKQRLVPGLITSPLLEGAARVGARDSFMGTNGSMGGQAKPGPGGNNAGGANGGGGGGGGGGAGGSDPVVQVLCGSHHAAALTRKGVVLTWGSVRTDGAFTSGLIDREEPHKLKTPLNKKVTIRPSIHPSISIDHGTHCTPRATRFRYTMHPIPLELTGFHLPSTTSHAVGRPS